VLPLPYDDKDNAPLVVVVAILPVAAPVTDDVFDDEIERDNAKYMGTLVT
jgi:hypothetical protein